LIFKYPLRFEFKEQGLVVEFTDVSTGTVVIQGTSNHPVGTYIEGDWTEHTSRIWTSITYSKRVQLHNKVKEFS